MNKRRLISVYIVVFLASLLISAVSARGGEFLIEPSHEVTENVALTVSDEVFGNLSVSNGFIDFYVTSPSGVILLRYNKTAFNTFNFVAEENGNFTMHLVNVHQSENVNATLNFMCELQTNVGFELSVEIASIISPPPMTTPIDWTLIITTILIAILAPFIESIAKAIIDFLKKIPWWLKHRKPRTPVIIKPL